MIHICFGFVDHEIGKSGEDGEEKAGLGGGDQIRTTNGETERKGREGKEGESGKKREKRGKNGKKWKKVGKKWKKEGKLGKIEKNTKKAPRKVLFL